MSAKVNEALFDLIQSMSKSEKRYFKLMSSRHTIGSENNYVKIFDYIGKLDVYDEEKLRKDFKGEAFLNRLSITKKRLYDHVLSALDSFHSSGSVEAQLYKMIHSSDILFEKSLYDQCRRTLRSAYKLAAKNDLKEVQLIISRKKKRLIETAGYDSVQEKELKNLNEEQLNNLRFIEMHNKLWHIKSDVFIRLVNKGVARNTEEVDVYTSIVNPLFDLEERVESCSECSYLLYHGLSAYYFAIGNLSASLDYVSKNLEHNHKKLLNEPNLMVSQLTNAIYLADKIGDNSKSNEFLLKLKQTASDLSVNEDLEIKLFSSISSIELNLLIRKGNFEGALLSYDKVQNDLERFGNKITPIRRAFIDFKFAVAYMGIGEFSSALKRVNNILNDSNLDKTEDIYGFTLLLDLLIHIELSHDQLLPYSLKSAQRFFKNRNRLYGFEKTFLQFVSKMTRCNDRFEIDQLWEHLYEELSKINDNNFECVALDYFDFTSWAESKLKGRPFPTLVKEKYYNEVKSAS